MAGTGAGQHDRLVVNGQLSLGGILDFDLADGYVLNYGLSTFELFGFSSRLGDFAGLSFDDAACTASGLDRWSCGSAVSISELFTGNSLSLQVCNVPEPASLALLGTGVAGLVWARRRQRPAIA